MNIFSLTTEERNFFYEAIDLPSIASFTEHFIFQSFQRTAELYFNGIPFLVFIPFLNLQMKCICLSISKYWFHALKKSPFWTVGEIFQWSIRKRNNGHLRGIYNADQRNLYFVSPNIISTEPPSLSKKLVMGQAALARV